MTQPQSTPAQPATATKAAVVPANPELNLRQALNSLEQAGFYEIIKDDKLRVRPELFDQIARALGKGFAEESKVSSNQLRGFYGEVKALEIKLQEMSRNRPRGRSGIDNTVFLSYEYQVRMIAPKVAYIQGKQTGSKVSREFREFIEKALNQVQGAEDFGVFMRLFESVVGFFYGFGGGKNR